MIRQPTYGQIVWTAGGETPIKTLWVLFLPPSVAKARGFLCGGLLYTSHDGR